MRSKIYIMIECVLIIATMWCCYKLGVQHNQNTIEERANDVDTECYSETDLEYIIFGEKQL